MKPLKLCFVAHNAYGAITGGNQGHIGGVERQTSMLAKLLVERGHHVSLVTWNESTADDETVDGVRVIKVCRREDGIPLLRFFVPRWTSLNRALKKADADVYYHNGAEYVTGQVAMWCRKNAKRFAFSSASDKDTDPQLPGLTTFRERVLYRYGLSVADGVLTQTKKQQTDFMNGLGVRSEIMPMPCPGPDEQQYNAPIKPQDGIEVLWVGRIHPVKRLEMLLDIAERAPEVTFHVAGGADYDPDYVGPLLKRMPGIPNVKYHGKLGREDVQALYGKCHALCCTSSLEGFPNTFLEAWSFGLPVVTTFDPDNVIAEQSLGIAGKTVQDMVEALNRLRTGNDIWQAMSQNSRQCYLDNYQVDAVIEKYERFFAGL